MKVGIPNEPERESYPFLPSGNMYEWLKGLEKEIEERQHDERRQDYLSRWDRRMSIPLKDSISMENKPMASREEMLDEAYRRGILPDDMKSAYEEAKKRGLVSGGPSIPERVGTGMLDPVVGTAQLAAHTFLPERPKDPGVLGQVGSALKSAASNPLLMGAPALISQSVENIGKFLPQAKKVQELPAQIDEFVKQREEGIQKSRGGDKGIDWWRVGGNALSPVSLLPAGRVATAERAASTLGTIGRGIGVGATSGGLSAAEQPVTAKDFWGTKTTDALLGTIFGAGVGTLTGGSAAAVRSIGDFIVREHPDSVVTQSIRAITKRLGEDASGKGVRSNDIVNLVLELQKQGVEGITLADVSGKNVQQLLGHIYRQGGPAAEKIRTFLINRDKLAGQRIASGIGKHLFSGNTAYEANEILNNAQKAQSKPFYAAMEMVKADSPQLEAFYAEPEIQQGLREGLKLARRASVAAGVKFDPEALVKNKTLALHDVVKKGLDKMIEDGTDAVTGKMNANARSLVPFKQAFVAAVDKADTQGIYKQARTLWAGPEASKNAIAFGKRALDRTSSGEANAAEFALLEPSEKEFARLGLADNMMTRMKEVGLSSDETKAIMKSEAFRERMAPFFDTPKDFQDFMGLLEREHDMFNLGRSVMGGSQTAERLATDTGADAFSMASSAHLARNLAERRWFTSLQMGLEMWRRTRDLGMKNNKALNEKIAEDLLTTPIPPTGQLAGRLKGSRAQRNLLPTNPNPLIPIENVLNLVGAPLATGAGVMAGQVQ